MATDTTFKDMLNEQTGLDSVKEILENKNLTKTKKLMMLVQLGNSMEEAKKLVETFKPSPEKPEDVFMKSPVKSAPKSKKKKGLY